MRILRWLFLLNIILVECQVNGQAKLGVTIDSFPTSGIIGDTTAYGGSIFLHNYGSSTFSDTFALLYSVNGSVYVASNPAVGIYLVSDTSQIPPGDSVKKSILIHFSPSIFQVVGSSGVVIWPISASAATYDSSSYQIVLTGPAGIAETAANKIKVYLDGQQLIVKTEAENLIKRVRIYDINGNLVGQQAIYSSATIPMDKYSSGMYFAVSPS